MGDSCSAACESVNDAARFFNVLQVAPGCVSTTLSDANRYPYFTRMAPSTRFNVVAIYEFMKLLGFKRVGVLYGYRSINNMIKDMFLEMVEADLRTGGYSWTILLTRQVSNRADAGSAVEFMKMRDSRVNFIALYEDLGAVLLCEAFSHGVVPPDVSWMVASGWWNTNYITLLAQFLDGFISPSGTHRIPIHEGACRE
ncbi:Gabbr2 [Symbiodinium sp. CCMP2456]|nr:Gabbr2 [Symbiodinium sp. CCMP2456]